MGVRADRMVEINADRVVLDNSWLWRADHDVTGNVYSCNNPVEVGLEVNGDSVMAYGLKVERTLNNLVEWNGEKGACYMFQSEFPYDVNQAQFGDPGYNAFRVDDSVTQFEGYGMGMYSFFRDNDVTVKNAIQAPQGAQGVQFTNVMTVFLSGTGEITHVIND